MPVTYTQSYMTTDITKMPVSTAATANTVTYGFDAPSGPTEFFMIRGDMTFSADPVSSTVFSLIDSLRIILDGDVVFDFRAGLSGDLNTPSRFGVLINAIGGRAYEVPSGTTTREFYAAIPIGRVTTGTGNATSRYEVVIGWARGADGVSVTSGMLQFWLQFNSAFTTQTTVSASTSFNHALNSIENVEVRIPNNIQGVVAGILVQVDSANDYLGTQGIRVVSQGSFGIEPNMLRFLNGNLGNGIMYADADLTTVRQEYSFGLDGCIFIPTYGLTGGNVTMIVDNTTACVRTYTPIITSNVGTKEVQQVRQTQPALASTAKSIIAPALD